MVFMPEVFPELEVGGLAHWFVFHRGAMLVRLCEGKAYILAQPADRCLSVIWPENICRTIGWNNVLCRRIPERLLRYS
jgi:hypothetical protein